jgi:glycosyltransferase involved in cell wall biosynthesis
MTGSGVFLQSLIREGDKKRYQQAVVYAAPKDSDDQNFIKEIGRDNHYQLEFESEDLPFPIFGMSDVMPYNSRKYSTMSDNEYQLWKESFTKIVERAIGEFSPDIIISHHIWLLTDLIKRSFPHIKLITVSHGTDIRQLSLTPRFKDILLETIPKVDMILALNNFQRDQILDEYSLQSDKVEVIGTGYNSSIFNSINRRSRSSSIAKITYIGKLSKAKGIEYLIKACSRLDPSKFKLILLSAGSGEEAEYLNNLLERSNFDWENLGFVTAETVGNSLRDCDIFILPSIYEGLPLVLLEALSCGLRVISTDLPGVKDWIGDEINGSGAINYIKLPIIENRDRVVGDHKGFEDRIFETLDQNIRNVIDGKPFDSDIVEQSLKSRTWEALFGKIEKIIKEI